MDEAISHIAGRVRAAAAAGTPLRIRGGGTKDFYGGPLQGELLDTASLAGIINHEPSELVVTVGAGTPLAELETALALHGQSLPFEPPHFAAGGALATVGGMVASGLAGPARAASGSVRDFVLGATLINGRGEVLSFGGQVMKNVAGYDVSRLLAGSLGTLGVVAAVSLKVLPIPPGEATLLFGGIDEADALQRLNRWAGQPLPINASCWLDGRLWLRLRGARAAVDAAVELLAATAQGAGMPVTDAAELPWLALREQTLPFFTPPPGHSLWRMAVPDSAPPLHVGTTLIEWGGAQRWTVRPAADAAWLREAATRAGGHATLFRAGADEPRTEVFTPLALPLARIHSALKAQFDPAGIFGRGRLYPDLYPGP